MSRGQGHEAAVPKARGLGSRGRGRCAHIFVAAAAAAAGVGAKNVVSVLRLASGGDRPDFEASLMPFDLGTLIYVALGL